MSNQKIIKSRHINSWSPAVERNIGFLCTIYVPPGLQGLIFKGKNNTAGIVYITFADVGYPLEKYIMKQHKAFKEIVVRFLSLECLP